MYSVKMSSLYDYFSLSYNKKIEIGFAENRSSVNFLVSFLSFFTGFPCNFISKESFKKWQKTSMYKGYAICYQEFSLKLKVQVFLLTKIVDTDTKTNLTVSILF